MAHNLLAQLENQLINGDEPILLFQKDNHFIYWVGISNETAFRCNVYLIVDGDEALVIDPGSRSFFTQIQTNISKVTPLENVKGLILCHQDPDVAASMIDWLQFNSNITIISSNRTNVLLPHYGIEEYNFFDICDANYTFSSGKQLQFIEAPFLHFPGAFTTLDLASHFLLSGDIWAALDIDWKLVVEDFEAHTMNMDLFHLSYMASNIAAKGFVNKLEGLQIDAILPQHGSVLDSRDVEDAKNYLKELRCGTDIIYGDIS